MFNNLLEVIQPVSVRALVESKKALLPGLLTIGVRNI